MALFNKLFQSKRNNVRSEKPQGFTNENDYIPFTFEKTQVRILLFRECERRGRKLLYDSADMTPEKTQANGKNEHENNKMKNLCDPEERQNSTCMESDIALLGEMIFGSVALNYTGMSLKIHVLKSPQRLMCTNVYCNLVRQRCSSDGFESSNGSISVHSDVSSSSRLSPWPSYKRNSHLTVSTLRQDRLTVDYCFSKNDSGFSSHPSSNNSISHQSSAYELWNKNDDFSQTDHVFSNSFYGADSNTIHYYINQQHSSVFEKQTNITENPARRKDSEVSRSSINSSSSEYLDYSDRHSSRRIKIGIAIIINLCDKSSSSMMTFLLDHAVFMEGALAKLKHAAHQALCKPQLFVCTMKMASSEVAQWLVDLLSSPRIGFPVWSNITTCSKILTKRKLADVFINDLCSLLSTMDTKDTYFFMSTLLTNILTFHLGWVNSVSPYTNTSPIDNCNPFRRQLGEMYGVIGVPSHASRTIVYGKENFLLVRKILSVLTYFIRSVNIKRYEIEESGRESWDNIDNCVTITPENGNQSDFTTSSSFTSHQEIDDIEMKTFSSPECVRVPKYEESIRRKMNQRSDTFVFETTSSKVLSLTLDERNAQNTLDVFTTESDGAERSVTEVEQESGECKVQASATASANPPEMRRLTRVQTGGLLSNFTSVSGGGNYGNQLPSDIVTVSLANSAVECETKNNSKSVVFILGDNEELIGLRDSGEVDGNDVTHSASPDSLNKDNTKDNIEGNLCHEGKGCSNQQLKSCCERKSQCQHSSKKHSGVKFDFEKYPQIVTNYMKSKNLDLLDRHVIGKTDNLKFVECEESKPGSSIFNLVKDCDTCQDCSFTGQGLQTPSNASELEYTSDIPDQDFHYAKECLVSTDNKVKNEEPKVFVKKKLSNTVVVRCADIKEEETDVTVSEIPMNVPTLKPIDEPRKNGYCDSLLGSVSDHYISNLVLQGGVGGVKSDWEKSLSQDLKLEPGTTCLLADIDEWSVQVFGSGGGVVGDMSTLVASMLDCIPQMCHAKVPSLQCLAFIESKLREICIRSKGLAQLLIDRDFCDMDYLTKALDLEPNDVPLLLAIASTHTPQATLKYGISYR